MYNIRFSIYDDTSVEVENHNRFRGKSFKTLNSFIKCLNNPKNACFKSLLELGQIKLHIYDYSFYDNEYVTNTLDKFLQQYADDSYIYHYRGIVL